MAYLKLGGRTDMETFNIIGLEVIPAFTRVSADWTGIVLLLPWRAIVTLQQESNYPTKVSNQLTSRHIFQFCQTTCMPCRLLNESRPSAGYPAQLWPNSYVFHSRLPHAGENWVHWTSSSCRNSHFLYWFVAIGTHSQWLLLGQGSECHSKRLLRLCQLIWRWR